MKKRAIMLLLAFFILFGFNLCRAASSDKGVYIIPVKGEIGPAVSSFISQNLKKAKELNCDIVIFDINTLGGKIKDTIEIQETVKSYTGVFRIYSFVNNKAESAGVMITLLGEKIYMTPDASIGSASVLPYDEKINSAWAGMLKGQAESMGRRGDIAQAMVDYDLTIPGIKEKGKLLNLTANSAKVYGYCDGIASNIDELVNSTYRGKRVFYADKDIKIKLSELVSNSYVATLLLLVGIVALIIEAFIPSFGIAGTIGLICIALYFIGNIFMGNTGWWALILFIVGIIFIAIEAAVPGFGVPGITGLVSLSVAIVLSARDLQGGLILLLAVLVVVIATIYILFKYGINSKLLSKIILRTEQKKENGYEIVENLELSGTEGIAVTQLRPSGIGIFNGKRYDIQSEGEFIKKNSKIVVVKVEGNKIFVKEKR